MDILTRRTAFNIYLYSPGIDLAECGRDTCLECPELPTCNKFIWPQYERKRAEAIEFYQKTGEEKLEKIEQKKKYSFREMIAIVCDNPKAFKDRNGKYNIAKVMLRFGTNSIYAQQVVKEIEDRMPLPTKNK